jgi:[ribosomal protein S5]-alanine N-acetyltransferase
MKCVEKKGMKMAKKELHHPYITGETIYLRGLEKNDIAGNWFNWFNNPEITYYMTNGERPNSHESLVKYYDQIKNSKDDFVFAIVCKKNNEHIGNCGLHAFDKISRQAKLGIVIGEKKYQGRGIGKEAVRLLIKYGFETLNLNKITLKVNSENVIAVRIYKKHGFVQEGKLRDDIYKNGRYYDSFVMSLFKRGYNGIKQKAGIR